MFDRYLIDAASIRNLGPDDAPTGFAFESKLGYYRGLGLSMIEALDVSIDGETLQAMVMELYATPPEVVARVQKILAAPAAKK